jgi:glycosyltransferase involved in cell wall biosynthesis
MVRILSFSHDSNLFGAQRSLLTLLEGLKERGHDVFLVCPTAGPLPELAKQRDLKVRICAYPYPSRNPIRFAKFLINYLPAKQRIIHQVQEIRPDIIHFNTSSCLAPSMALQKSKLRRVHHLRERAPALAFTSGLIARGCDLAIANCSYIGSFYKFKNRNLPLKIVHNGLDIELPDEGSVAAARSEWSIRPEEKLILFAGQLRPHKDPLAVIETAKLLQNSNSDFRFGIFGSGPLEAELRRQIQAQNLESLIWLAGFKSDLTPYLKASSVVFIPSLEEPFPRVGLEAMAMGKPIVASNVGGIPEQVFHDLNGFVREAKDYRHMSHDILMLLTNSELSARMGNNGLLKYRQLYTTDAYVTGVEKLFIELVGS